MIYTMMKRFSILCLSLLLALFYSFTGHHKERVDFSRVERRMLHIPTAGLFGSGDYFTVSPSDLERDGWCFLRISRMSLRGGISCRPTIGMR